MLTDIASVGLSSQPNNFATVGETVLFEAAPDWLWRTDGSAAGTTVVSAEHRVRSKIVSLGERGIYLSFTDNSRFSDLVSTDGTPEGTQVLATFANTSQFIVHEGTAYFLARESTSGGYEFWRSDGTQEGTRALVPEANNLSGSFFRNVSAGGFAYYSTTFSGVWQVDIATGQVRKLPAPASIRSPHIEGIYGSQVYFSVSGSRAGRDLYVFDEANRQVRMLATRLWSEFPQTDGQGLFYHRDQSIFVADAAGSRTVFANPSGTQLQLLGVAANTLYFAYGSSTRTLWTITPDGEAQQVGDFDVDVGRFYRHYDLDGVFLLLSQGGLFRSDGTADGSYLLHEGLRFVHERQLGHEFVFWATEEASGFEPWITDGTRAGTRILADITPGPDSSRLSTGGAFTGDNMIVTPDGNTLLFRIGRDEEGVELWRTDGTSDGTQLVKDLFPNTPDSDPHSFLSLGDRFLFFARYRPTPQQSFDNWLFVSDGTSEGTQPLLKINISLRLGAADGVGYFRVGDRTLVTDGTPEGTKVVDEMFFHFAFGAPMRGDANGLWRLEGQEVIRLAEGPFRMSKTNVGFYIEKHDEVWVTDGTPEGTRPARADTIETKGTLLVSGERWISAEQGVGIWAAASADASPELVLPGNFRDLVVIGQKVYAVTWRQGLSVTDGTAAGSFRLSRHPVSQIAAAGDTLVFRVGNELWTSRGTRTTTDRLRTFTAPPEWLLEDSGQLLFVVPRNSDGDPRNSEGFDLWETDGTLAGTRPSSEFPHLASYNAVYRDPLKFSGGYVYVGDDGQHGTEPWIDRTRAVDQILGDLDQDGDVDFTDFLQLAAQFNTTCDDCVADLTGDGQVNFSDFLLLAANFGTTRD